MLKKRAHNERIGGLWQRRARMRIILASIMAAAPSTLLPAQESSPRTLTLDEAIHLAQHRWSRNFSP